MPDRFIDAMMEDELMTMKDVEQLQDKRYSWLNEQLVKVDSHVPKVRSTAISVLVMYIICIVGGHFLGFLFNTLSLYIYQ